jgi:hypothetical protein
VSVNFRNCEWCDTEFEATRKDKLCCDNPSCNTQVSRIKSKGFQSVAEYKAQVKANMKANLERTKAQRDRNHKTSTRYSSVRDITSPDYRYDRTQDKQVKEDPREYQVVQLKTTDQQYKTGKYQASS